MKNVWIQSEFVPIDSVDLFKVHTLSSMNVIKSKSNFPTNSLLIYFEELNSTVKVEDNFKHNIINRQF